MECRALGARVHGVEGRAEVPDGEGARSDRGAGASPGSSSE